MTLPRRIVSVWAVVSLLAHSLLVMAASPSHAYAITLGEAQAAAGLIGAGTTHSLVRTADDTVAAWGDGSEGQTSLSGLAGVTRVAAGGAHSLALLSDGTIVAAGSDSYGQCEVPPDLTDVIAIAAGAEHSLALRANGTVVAWGGNGFGQSNVPPSLTGIKAIAAGAYHSLALRTDGTVVAWGDNGFGQSSVPSTLTGIEAIAAGGYHSLALRSNGTVTGWGRATERQLLIPTGLSGVVEIAAGFRHSLALKSNGTVVAWGGMNADGIQESSVSVPSGLDGVVAISAGWLHSLALRSDGTPVGWGSNSFGQSFGTTSVDPSPYSKDVPTDAVFRLAHSAPIKPGGTYSEVRLEDSQGGAVPIDKAIEGTRLIITPSAALQTDERYVLRVPAGSLADDYGNISAGGMYYYDTLDTIPPAVVAVQPGDGAVDVSVHRLLSVVFSERIAQGPSVDEVTLVSGSGHEVECRYSVLTDMLMITPLEALDPETSYALTIPPAAVTDPSGNPLETQFSSSFTTGRTHTISATATAGGNISPSGEVIVDHGANRTFAVTPDTHYEVASVFVDGVTVELMDGTYTFENVTADHTIAATFTGSETFTLSYTAGVGGAISGTTPQTVAHNGSGSAVTAAPNAGYRFVRWSDGRTDNPRTDTDVTGNVTVTAEFELESVDPRPDPLPSIISGSNRYVTAIEGSKAAFPDGAPAVVLATGVNFADALGGAGLAGALGCPLLLTPKSALSDSVSAEITRLGATQAYILGGIGAISADVESALKAKLGEDNVVRIAGDNRYDTAYRIATETIAVLEDSGHYSGDAFVATGANFPDALGASPVAASQGMPVFLASPARPTVTLPPSVERVWITGGTAAVSAQVEASLEDSLGEANVTRLAGTSRFDTAALVAAFGVSRGMSWDGVGITTGKNFPDALAAGPVLGSRDTVMLLTDKSSVPAPTRDALSSNSAAIDAVTFFGGDAAVPPSVRQAVLDLVQ